LNDFVFCPASIYFHELYGNFNDIELKDIPQLAGSSVHETIDNAVYSTHSDVLQGVWVYSEEFNICGKIDVFDVEKELLTERKKKVLRIYDGYVFQLYAQYFGLTEMGYKVSKLRIVSFDDRKVFPIPLPSENPDMYSKFKTLMNDMRHFELENFTPNVPEKCHRCIYSNLCDRALV
jgi:RecB family exonuclease